MLKSRAQRHHAKARGAERYGLVLTNDDLKGIVQDIQRGKATLVEKQSRRVTIFDVTVWRPAMEPYGALCREIEGVQVPVVARVVYDKERGQIASFLPR